MSKNVILCVDDEKIILDSIKAQLKEYYGNSFLYETAESAAEALEIIDEIMVDKDIKLVIITDWFMPVIKGDEFLYLVHQKYPLTLNIMLTGHADPESVKRSKKEGNLFRCIRKPWIESELISTIDSCLVHT
ncbi:response regulator [Mangrovibacterium sp.]|uniref:response regulator n=1 Tax=Mangrovibacterium sp. TaxID=1961364 RepID=UPI00356A6409